MVKDKFGVGDGYTKYFQLRMHPVRGTTEVITLDNAAQTRDTHYTIDNDTGLITMTSTPSNGQVLRAQTYQYNAFSDTEIDQILSDYGNDINMSAAHCCRILATVSAKFFVYWSSTDERVDRTKECDNFRKMAADFEKKAQEEQSGDIAIGVLRSEVYNEDDDDWGVLQD